MISWEEWQKADKELKEYRRSLNPLPKCPLCGYEDIKRISTLEKAGNTVAFGFFGNKRNKQFQCLNPNCKYLF